MEYRLWQSILYETDKKDKDGRPILTKVAPEGRALIEIDGVEYMALRDVAKRIDCEEQALRHWVWQGKAPAIKVGRLVYIEKEWVTDRVALV